jgi:putative endonuclease
LRRAGRDTASPGRRETGDSAERAARGELERRGYRIVAANYRCRGGEIDLVAREGDAWVFVEVRSHSVDAFGPPRESIRAGKQRRLSRAAAAYLRANRLNDVSWRFDVAEVRTAPDGRVQSVEVIENAFRPRGVF